MRKSKNISELNGCFMDIFVYILQLKKVCAFETHSFSQVYRQTRSLFNSSAERAIALGIDIRKFDKARFAVCAWTDETLSTMSWLYNQQWLNHTLQKEFYGLSNANTAFYTRLNALKPEEYAVREIFLYCLYLGYCGQFVLESDKPLLRQMKLSNLYSLVDSKLLVDSLYENSIFRDAYPVYVPRNRPCPNYLQATMLTSTSREKLNQPILPSLSVTEHAWNKVLATKGVEFNRKWNRCVTKMKKTIQKYWAGKSSLKRAWYIVIGEKGQGKTSLLQASEALLPIENRSVNTTGIGVDSLGFWEMRDSIILDTPGELIEQHNEEATIMWWNLLKQVKRFRHKNSLSGIILCISAETLRNHNKENLQQKGENIKRRIIELSDILNSQYPVYVIVTQCNKLDNQQDYFENFPIALTKQAMGKLYQVPHEEYQLKEVIDDTLHYIYEQLNILRLLSLRHKASLARVEHNLGYPEKFLLLKHGLNTLLQPVFRTDQEMREKSYAYLRGIFFTSVDVQKQKDKTKATKNVGYFLQELFTVILPSDKY